MSPQWIADDLAREEKAHLMRQWADANSKHHGGKLRWTPAQWRKVELVLFAAYWFAVGVIAGWVAALEFNR